MTERRLRALGIAAALGAWLYLLIFEIFSALNRVTEGFAAYYAAAYAVLHGGAADLNSNPTFAPWLARAGISVNEVYQGNTPTLALLMSPLTLFSPAIAQTIWLIINAALLIACVWLAGRIVAPDNVAARWWIAATFALLAPVRETLRFGQVYLLIALLSLLAVRSLMIKRDRISGVAVAIIGLLKAYYGVLIFGLLVWSRRPRSVIAVVVTVAMVVVISLPLLAPAWPGYVNAQIGIGNIEWASIPANQTLNSFILHLFTYVPVWNPSPIAEMPTLALVLHITLIIVLVAVTLRRAMRHDPLWIWLPALTLLPVLSPVGEIHHYTLLLLPVAAAVVRLADYIQNRSRDASKTVFDVPRIRWTTALVLLAGLTLLVMPWPSLRDPALWGGWRGLLAYPRLMGALLLWAGLLIVPKEWQQNKQQTAL